MRKKLILLLQIIIAVVLVTTSVYATVNTTLELSVSPDTIEKGKEVAVTLSLKNVDSQKKIKSIKGYINYDENVLETVTVDSIVKSEDNTVKIGNETLKVEDLTNLKIEDMPDTSSCVSFNSEPVSDNDIMIIIDFSSGISADTDLITIKFKVKSDADIGAIEKAIEYKSFVITDGSNKNSEEITQNVKLTITDINKDDTNKDDTNKDDTNKDDTNKDDTNKDDTNKGDTNKGDTNKGDTNKGDTNKGDTNKGDTNKNETNKNEINKNKINTNKVNTNNNMVVNRIRNNTVDNTIAAVVLPATGARAIIIPTIIFILCAYIFYNRYMKYKDI